MRTWPALEVGPLPNPDLFQAALLDYDVSAIDETTEPDAWRVFFGSEADRTAAAKASHASFRIRPYASLDVPDEDWVARVASQPPRGDASAHHRGAPVGRARTQREPLPDRHPSVDGDSGPGTMQRRGCASRRCRTSTFRAAASSMWAPARGFSQLRPAVWAPPTSLG